MEPIVLGNITPDMELWWEEIFGPVIACTVADHTNHAIELANQSHHGLGAYLFTSNPVELQTVPARIQTGMVGVNTGAISMPQTPFGGVKQSGFGREGSIEGLCEYLTTQTIFRNIH
jgi:succinate-semialdehyde dehydrogenase/glutarate-semialdehyde dehydrogenase